MDDDESFDYQLSSFDRKLLAQVTQALVRCFASPKTTWAEKTSIAKLLHVFSRVPARSSPVSVEVGFSSPRCRFDPEEIYFWLDIGVSDRSLTIRFGGHYHHPSSGGDSFSVFSWSAIPGQEPERTSHLASLRVVTALIDPMEALQDMTTSPSMDHLEVIDPTNELLEDEAPEDDLVEGEAPDEDASSDCDYGGSPDDIDGDAPDELPRGVSVSLVTAADRSLLAKFSSLRVQSTSAGEAYGIETCDGCGVQLSTVGLLVDGQAPDGAWGNYCAACSFALGLTIGWGKGQLYARQTDGTWHGVAGFEH